MRQAGGLSLSHKQAGDGGRKGVKESEGLFQGVYKQTVRHCTDRLLWLPDRPRLILMAGRNPICPLSLEFREKTNTTVLIPSNLSLARLVFMAMLSVTRALLRCTDTNSSPSA
jgi:hypothetical protein